MGRRAGLSVGLVALAGLVGAGACGGAPKPTVTELARGVLAYDVASDAASARLASVELATDFQLVVRALPTGRELSRTRLGPADWDVLDLALASDGKLAAVASLDATVRLFDLTTGAARATWRLDAGATAVAFNADASLVVTGSESGVLCLRRVVDGALLQCVAAHQQRVAGLATCGDRLVSVGWDGRAVAWTLPSLAVQGEWQQPGVATAVAISPDCRRAAVGRGQLEPRRLPVAADPTTRVEIFSLTHDAASETPTVAVSGGGPRAPLVALAFTDDGTRVVGASWDGGVYVFDAADASPSARFGGFAGVVRGLAILRGDRLAVASWAGEQKEGRAVTIFDLGSR